MAAKEKRGLGLGLDALFAANDLDEPEGELLTLPISKVEPREAQPRKSFDEEARKWLYSYDVLGLWDGYDEDTRMPSRAVTSLYQVEGQEFEMLYPCCDMDGVRTGDYQSSQTLTMIRGLEIVSTPLPVGAYYGGFVIRDIFGHRQETPLTRMDWDGETFTLVE